jgi:hypothetical protein
VLDDHGVRFDARWRFAVTESLHLRLGGAFGEGGQRSDDLDREASLGLVTGL